MSQILPIDALRARFEAQLSESDLVVAAATGSGKSTRLPLWAAQQGRVLVIEPRRIACTALAGYLAEQSGTPLGGSVGYAIRFDTQFNDNTSIVFATPGVALRWFADNKLGGFDTVILDEFHERRWDTDLLLALLKQHASHRLVLTSATLNTERLAGYLEAAVLTSEGRSYPVDVSYRAAESHQMPQTAQLETRVRDGVEALMAQTEGDLLVFLPGKGEIRRVQSVLNRIDADIIPLHAGVSKVEQARALTVGDRRRVILATNVAETSLTIPGVTGVIDTGLERRTHQRNGRTVLGLHPVSQASAEQRRGRAGRLSAGQCIRLWGEHAPIETVTPPEIQREELTELVLAAARAGYRADHLQFADPLPEKSFGIAVEKLQQMVAIDAEGVITEHGRALFPLPIDSIFAHLITAMEDESSRGAMVDLAAVLSSGARWYRLPESEQGLQAVQAWLPLGCDAATAVALLRGEAPEEIRVEAEGRAEARRLARQIRDALGMGAIPDQIDFDRDCWLRQVIKAQPSLAFVRRKKRREAMGNGYSEVLIGDQTRLPDEAEAAVVFDEYSVPGRGKRQTLNIGTCLAPVGFDLLADAGLGDAKMGSVILEQDQLLIERELCYVERVIQTSQLEPEGALAREAIAALLMKGRLMPGVGEALCADLSAWQLYVALGEAEAESTNTATAETDPQRWLAARLEQLGVESYEDMALIDADDLRFSGVPDWKRTEFDQRYPSELLLGDLRLRVHYEVRRRQVTVEKIGGLRKTDPKRWELPAWSGWKIRFKKASRVVDIR